MERRCIITDYFIGLDLGRDRDYSAVAILALRQEEHGDFDRQRLVQPSRRIVELIGLKRIPLGTEYIRVIGYIRRLVSRLHARAGWGAPAVRVHLIMDSAGPGQVALELIRAQKMDINFVPAILTAGHEHGRSSSGKATVPRREIIGTLRYLLEMQLLRLHRDHPHAGILRKEVAAVRPDGGQYAHDDLVIATALAAWYSTRAYRDLIRPAAAA
ncbi:MAG: hypothetical protein JNM66_11150 [Bryobacterales bacterium]|nr:hypothetical protein [Bryobacterales bacterium]